jgi:hypothetical protein
VDHLGAEKGVGPLFDAALQGSLQVLGLDGPVPTKIRSPGWIFSKMAFSGQKFFFHLFFIAFKSEQLSSG